MRLFLTSLIAAIAGSLLLPTASARFARPTDLPVERLITNVNAYVKTHPDDPQGYYTLGRIHYRAFAMKMDNLTFYGPDNSEQLPSLTGQDTLNPRARYGDAEQSLEQRRQHVSLGLYNLRLAIKMEPRNALYRLTHASLMEQAAEFAGGMGWPPEKWEPPAAMKEGADDSGLWLQAAADEYLAAINASREADATVEEQPIRGLISLVSYEAGTAYVRLIDEMPDLEHEADQLAAVERHLEALDAKPRGAITPVITANRAGQPLAELLEPARAVAFDLDGTGRAQRWQWMAAETGVLVWDPTGEGRIDTGRQLFGHVTWWIIWRDGYAALDALDDSRDGWLTGPELAGIRLWTDANQDAISQPGEVVDLSAAGITAIATRADSVQDGSPAASTGIQRRSGLVPSYDWLAQPAPE